jgi:hypothetical protein
MNKNILIVISSLIFIIILILIINNFFTNNNFENNNIDNNNYINKNELQNYLIKDIDNYYKNFSDKDFIARKVSNIEHYQNNIKLSCIDINNNIKKTLNNCINKANYKLKKYSCVGFDGPKCANIKWKIGVVKDKLYEEGYPHTRNDVIIIPLYLLNNSSQLVNTLIHEKIHVYQKLYPEDINEYLQNNGFTKYKLRSEYNEMFNTRSNPDMDEWIYKDKDGNIMMAEYIDNPKSIMDVKTIPINNSKYEHPFEYMAYDITEHL